MWFLLSVVLAADLSVVHGVTLSTPTYGPEWGTQQMDTTLGIVKEEGANWISYHPYASVDREGHVRSRLDPNHPPDWLLRPIRDAHARGLNVMVKPHLAYWGSFRWRGEIQFDDPVARARFFREYTRWITALAQITRDADAFVVGTELDGLRSHEQEWRRVIRSVRAVHPGHLTYAANWDTYTEIPFWDALDTIGVQAYFPLVDHTSTPTNDELRAGWAKRMPALRELSARTGKPVVFTELGYDASPLSAKEPWRSGNGASDLQTRLLRVALQTIDDEPTIRGAFLWKWFPGEVPVGDFRLSQPALRRVMREAWR